MKLLDEEIKSILTKLLEGQEKLTSEVGSLKGEVGSLKGEVQKNSIKLESIEKKIDIIAEMQTAHKEQNEKAHNEIIKPLDEKISVIELAVKDTSRDVKELKQGQDEIKEDLKKVKVATGNNCIEIEYLKATK